MSRFWRKKEQGVTGQGVHSLKNPPIETNVCGGKDKASRMTSHFFSKRIAG